MKIVTNGAFIERKAEANDGRVFAAREEVMAEWASSLKDLRSAVDRLGNQLSTMASAAAQICSPRTNINQLLHQLESKPKRSVPFSPSVNSPTSPPSPPTILPITPIDSCRQPYQPEILPCCKFAASPVANFPHTVITSSMAPVPSPVARIVSTVSTITQIRSSTKSASVFIPSSHILQPSTSEQILSLIPAGANLDGNLSSLGSLSGDDEPCGTKPCSGEKNRQWLLYSLRGPTPSQLQRRTLHTTSFPQLQALRTSN